MEQDKEFNKDTEVEQDQVMETAKEEHQEEEYDDVCFVCHRPSSKAGKMIHLTPEIHICAECMQRTMDMMNNGNIDYSKMDFSRMPNISMVNLSDLQNMIPKRQRVKKKAPEQKTEAQKAMDIRSIPAPHKPCNVLITPIVFALKLLLLCFHNNVTVHLSSYGF